MSTHDILLMLENTDKDTASITFTYENTGRDPGFLINHKVDQQVEFFRLLAPNVKVTVEKKAEKVRVKPFFSGAYYEDRFVSAKITCVGHPKQVAILVRLDCTSPMPYQLHELRRKYL